MHIVYGVAFLAAFILSSLLTPRIKRLALKYKIVDNPSKERKIHTSPIPLLGGASVIISFLSVVAVSSAVGWMNDGIIEVGQIVGIVLGSCVLMIGGYLDDKYELSPGKSFMFPVLASLVAVMSGIAIKYVTNPFIAGSGPYGRALFYFEWVDLSFISFAGLFSFLWILGMIYTTKFLDGLDGLVTGIGSIGAIILFIVSLFWDVPMSATSILCLIMTGSLLGFLIYNFHPAKIFLGEGGATWVGFMLGVLAIISGGKIATALLVMGLPILDVVWSITRRLVAGKHIYTADRKHLHFRLLDSGLSHRKTVLLLYLVSLIFGVSSLFLQSSDKVIALGILMVVMIILATASVVVYKRKNT